MPFLNLPLRVSTVDGRNFTLLEPLEYETKDGTHYRAVAGTQTDGASTPRGSWNVTPPFGDYFPAAVLHDAAYRCTLERQNPNGQRQRVQLAKTDADSLLMEAMASLGVPEALRLTIYEAVRYGGNGAFSSDLAMPIK